jgi:hypothetical protein
MHERERTHIVMSRQGGKASMLKLAREHHRCPEGYKGPCWGPTFADYEWARQQLTQ